MTSNSTLGSRLTEVDELTRSDHYHLTPQDGCFYFGEYTARKGFSHSDTNQLIINFKKKMDRKGRSDWQHKERAILTAGGLFRNSIGAKTLQKVTHVPIPPSKARDHPLYDDRVLRMISVACQGLHADIRELIAQKQSTAAAHESDQRPTLDELIQNYAINEVLAAKTPEAIFLYDDVLTTGAHFKAAQHVLSKRFPDVPVLGLFIARRVPEADDLDDVFDMVDLL